MFSLIKTNNYVYQALVIQKKKSIFKQFLQKSFYIKILYQHKMGKTLRNRQLNEQIDGETDLHDKNPLSQEKLNQGRLRQLLKLKNLKKLQSAKEKIKKFKSHLKEGNLCQIVSETQFECAICLQLMVSPIMMICGHMFCIKCIESNSVYNQRCCLCRKDQENHPFILNSLAENVIQKFLLPNSPSYLNYLCRTTDGEQWSKRRRLPYIRQNLVVDFRDRFGAWRRAVVTELFHQKSKLMTKIRVPMPGIDYMEVVEATSRRLAPQTFFTKKRYLEEFTSGLPEYNPSDFALANLEYRLNGQESLQDIWSFQEREEVEQNENIMDNYEQNNEENVQEILVGLDLEVDHYLHLLS